MPDERLLEILRELRRGLERILGERLDRVLLYGSHARGEARPGSDVDVLVVIHGDFDYWELIEQTSSIICDLSLKNDLVISRAFVSKERFEHDVTPFLLNIRREAVMV